MSYKFYTTETNEDKLKEHILKQMQAASDAASTSDNWLQKKAREQTMNLLASAAAESIIEVQKRGITSPKEFSLAVRSELVKNHMSTLKAVSALSAAESPQTEDDVATKLTGVDSKGNITPLIIENTTTHQQTKIATLYDEMQKGAPAPQVAAAPPPPTPSPSPAKPEQPAPSEKPTTSSKPAVPTDNTTKPVPAKQPAPTKDTPPTPAQVSSPSTPSATTASAPSSDFNTTYKALGGIIGMTMLSLEDGLSHKKDKNTVVSESAVSLNAAIVTSLKPKLIEKHVDFDDKDLATVADITSKTIAAHLYKLKEANPNLKITDPNTFQREADKLGAEIHDALAQADKEKKLGKLSDGIVSYVDILSGVNASGNPTARNGTNFHTLGATALAQAFGDEAVQDYHKKEVAKQFAKDQFVAQGATLDSSSLNETVQTTLASQHYSDATIAAVQNITRRTFGEKDTFADTRQAWDRFAEEEKAEGKNSFFDMMKRFLMFVDALLEAFTGFSIMNSIMGAGSNPISNKAHEVANERHLKGTYETIIQTNPTELGYTTSSGQTPAAWRQKLAETTTGIVKLQSGDYDTLYTNGRKGGLAAAVNGLDTQGNAQGVDISDETPAEKARREADEMKKQQKPAEEGTSSPPPKSKVAQAYAGR